MIPIGEFVALFISAVLTLSLLFGPPTFASAIRTVCLLFPHGSRRLSG